MKIDLNLIPSQKFKNNTIKADDLNFIQENILAVQESDVDAFFSSMKDNLQEENKVNVISWFSGLFNF